MQLQLLCADDSQLPGTASGERATGIHSLASGYIRACTVGEGHWSFFEPREFIGWMFAWGVSSKKQ
jgi:hypothetical protein